MDAQIVICGREPLQPMPAPLRLGIDLSLALDWTALLLGLAESQAQVAVLRQRLAQIVAGLPEKRGNFSVQAVNGDPEKAILVAVGETPALVVTGPFGRGSLARRLWGPIAGELVHHLPGPLLFVPDVAPASLRRILLPIGGLRYSHAAAEMGALLARAFGAQVTLLHVVHHYPNAPLLMQAPTKLSDFLASDTIYAQHFREAMDFLAAQQIDVTPRVRVGNPLPQILAEIAAYEYDLLVIGSHYSAGAIAQLIGGISQSAIRETPIPILVARQPATPYLPIPAIASPVTA